LNLVRRFGLCSRCLAPPLLLDFLLPPIVNGLHSEVDLQREIAYLLNVAAHEHIRDVLFESLGEPLGDSAGISACAMSNENGSQRTTSPVRGLRVS
jgi:hypothetical protein